MDNKLISMVDFIEEVRKNSNVSPFDDEQKEIDTNELYKIFRYAHFISQQLSEPYKINKVTAHPLNRFAPCDLEGSVLEEPKYFKAYSNYNDWKDSVFEYYFDDKEDYNDWNKECLNYQQAKDRCIFEDCSMFDEFWICFGEGNLFPIKELKNTTIEWFCDKNMTLTLTALKQIGL